MDGAVTGERAAYHGATRHFECLDGRVAYVGIIDVLESWRCKWAVQSWVLHAFFRYVACSQLYNPRGITALRPVDYAARFEEFCFVHLLGLPHTSRHRNSWQPFW